MEKAELVGVSQVIQQAMRGSCSASCCVLKLHIMTFSPLLEGRDAGVALASRRLSRPRKSKDLSLASSMSI